MRIALAAFVLQGGRTGVAAYCRNLIRALQAIDEENEYEILLPRRDRALIEVSKPNFSVVAFPDYTANPLVSLAWHNLVLPRLAGRRGYDLVHVPSYRRLPWIRGRVPVVGTVHDLAAFAVEGKYDRLRMFFNLRLVPPMIRRAAFIMTVSRFTRDDILRIARVPEQRVRVIYSGIDHDRFRPIEPAAARAELAKQYDLTAPFLVYVGRIEHPAKGHVQLLDAFSELAREHPEMRLVFAGADWHGAEVVDARIRGLGLEGKVVRLGFVPEEMVPCLYSACSAMVFPSLFEGFGFPLIEAMACGAPVACSDTSSLRELAGGLVPTFDPHQPVQILEAIRACLRTAGDEAERRARIEYANGFQWARAAAEVLEVYREVGRGGGGV